MSFYVNVEWVDRIKIDQIKKNGSQELIQQMKTATEFCNLII